MKVFVPLKRVIDPYVKVRIKTDESGVERQNVKMAINPFDEIAIEQAVQLKEQGVAQEVIVASIGDKTTTESLRSALALGADKAIHVVTEKEFEPLNIAKILAHLIGRDTFDMVIMGKQTIDGDNNQTGQMLASLLAWPQATFASKIVFDGPNLVVTREIDGGLETLNVSLPAVITTDLRLNEPRYASLPNIMKAKRKPIDDVSLDELGLELKQHIESLAIRAPENRKAGVMVDSVKALVDKLRNEAKVI